MDEFENLVNTFIGDGVKTDNQPTTTTNNESASTAADQPSLVDRMRSLTDNILATYSRKNADYGNSFGKSVERYGLISALTRMSDKWNRLETLILNGGNRLVNDESLIDTLMDLATYCLMTVMEIEGGEKD